MSELKMKSPAGMASPAASPGSPRLRYILADFCASRSAVLGLAMLLGMVLLAIAAPLVSPQNPYDLDQLNILDGRLPPGSESMTGGVYWLGTDVQGRDMWSGILYGLRISLLVGLSSALIACTAGMVVGLIAGYCGGRIDAMIMRLVDLQLSFPSILIALMLLAVTGRGVDKIILALVIVQWAYYARTVRASTLAERKKEYVAAANCLYLPQWRVLFLHILPNCMPSLIVVLTVQVANAITLEATLSFLGVGLPITEPSLGLLIANGFNYIISGRYWISLFPGIALLLLIVSINLVGDQLRDTLNPRLSK